MVRNANSSFSFDNIKGIYLSIALTCMIFFMYKQKLLFLSRRQIPLATLLYEQFIHLSLITLRPNIQLSSNLFRVTSWFYTVYNIVTRWMNFRENHLHEHELKLSDYNI